MRAHEKDAGEQEIFVQRPQSGENERHDEQLEDFYTKHHRAFAAAVGEKTAGHGKQNERQREQRADGFAEMVFLHRRHAGAEDGDKNDEVFDHIVAERALELRDEQAPKAAQGFTSAGFWLLISGF